MSSCLSKFVGRQSAGTATRAMPAREPAFIRKILRAPRHERDAVHTHTRLHDGPTQTMRLHTAADANLSKQDEEQRSWRRVETYTTMSHQHAAWSCPAWRRAAGRAETCTVDRCEERRPVTGDRRQESGSQRAGSPVAAAVRPPRLAARDPAIAWDERPAEEIERPGVLPAPPAVARVKDALLSPTDTPGQEQASQTTRKFPCHGESTAMLVRRLHPLPAGVGVGDVAHDRARVEELLTHLSARRFSFGLKSSLWKTQHGAVRTAAKKFR